MEATTARPIGRPTVWTETARARFLEAIGKGVDYKGACAYAGVSYSAWFELRKWTESGRRASPLRDDLRQFLQQVQLVEGSLLATSIDGIVAAGTGQTIVRKRETVRQLPDPNRPGELIEERTTETEYDTGQWRALAWWAERRYPKQWGRRDRSTVNMEAEAAKLAAELGVPVDELIAEAEAFGDDV